MLTRAGRATTVTAIILIAIESMNVIVACVEFTRYVLPAVMAVTILSTAEGNFIQFCFKNEIDTPSMQT